MSIKKSQVDKYTIIEKIAKGGMGDIYRAKHPTLNKDVILKRLNLSGNMNITERFKREAQLMIDFRDDRIVQVYDHFKEGQSYYIVMEYVDGVTLSQLIDKNRYLPNEMAMLIFNEICKALKYAHDKGVIHRDIKPENVLISRDGIVKLTDFGIATSKDCEDECLTREMTLGTPAYMSPEQISDSKSVDKRADIYSMGVVLYKMVTGKCPFPGNISPETINLIQKGKYILPRKLNPKVTPVVQKIIKKAMHHNVKKRYKDLQYIISILTKKLKKFRDQETVNETIRNYIYNNKSDKKTVKKTTKQPIGGSSFGKIALGIIIILCMITGGLWYAYKQGYHYEFYKTDEYGALQIEVKAPKKSKDYKIRYIAGKLLIKDKRGYSAVEDLPIKFSEIKNDDDKNHLFYKSQRIYLKTAEYRVSVDINNEMYQKDFFLKARMVQKKEKASNDAQIIIFNHTEIQSMPMQVVYTARDSSTNNIITDEVSFYIFLYNKWIKWQDIQKDAFAKDLVTGKKYFFKFQHDNYLTEIINVSVEPYQAALHLEADLIPIPGTLMIKSNEPGVDFFINNASYYISGGKNKKMIKLEPLTQKFQWHQLSPGNYYITVQHNSIKRTETIEVSSKKYTKVLVFLNKATNAFDIKIY